MLCCLSAKHNSVLEPTSDTYSVQTRTLFTGLGIRWHSNSYLPQQSPVIGRLSSTWSSSHVLPNIFIIQCTFINFLTCKVHFKRNILAILVGAPLEFQTIGTNEYGDSLVMPLRNIDSRVEVSF